MVIIVDNHKKVLKISLWFLLLFNPSEIPDWYECNRDCCRFNSAVSPNGERVDASLQTTSKVLPCFSVHGEQCCQDQTDLNSAPEIHSKHVQGDIYNYCQGNWDVQSWKRDGVDYGCGGIWCQGHRGKRYSGIDFGSHHGQGCEAARHDVEEQSWSWSGSFNFQQHCQEWRLLWKTETWLCTLNRYMLSRTCCDPMSEGENSQGVDGSSSQKRRQNFLESPLMVKLVELSRLKHAHRWILFQLNFIFTLRIRKIRVRLTATRTPCRSQENQYKTNCRVIARGSGTPVNIVEMNMPPHRKERKLHFDII